MASERGGPWEYPEAGEKCGINSYCGNKHALYLDWGQVWRCHARTVEGPGLIPTGQKESCFAKIQPTDPRCDSRVHSADLVSPAPATALTEVGRQLALDSPNLHFWGPVLELLPYWNSRLGFISLPSLCSFGK